MRPLQIRLFWTIFSLAYISTPSASYLNASTPSVWSQLKYVGQTAISDNGRLIAYTVAKPAFKNDVFNYLAHINIVSTDGRLHDQFTRGDRSCFQPAFSPDGQYLSFLTARSSNRNRQIWILPLAGGESWPITDSLANINQYKWSADSKQILYLSQTTRAMGNQVSAPNLQVIRIDNNDLPHQSISQDMQYGNIITFDWSSSPNLIWLSHQNETGTFTIASLNIDSKAYTIIRQTEFPVLALRCSPDEKHIAFCLKNSSIGRYQLFTMNANGSQVRQISEQALFRPDIIGWTPKNKNLIFTAQEGTSNQIFRMELNDELPTALTRKTGLFRDVCLSGDGRTLAFVYERTDSPANVYVSGINKTVQGKLTNLNVDLKNQPEVKTERVTWRSHDNSYYHGLLTYPINYEYDRRYPLMLIINNNPNDPFVESYVRATQDYPIQLFSEKGYAVFLANFPLYKESDTVPQENYLSAINQILGMGIAHPDSLCLLGWNRGGMSAIQLALTTNRFKVLSVCSGENTIFDPIKQNHTFSFEGKRGINWLDLSKFFGSSTTFRIKGYELPTQMLLLSTATAEVRNAELFRNLLIQNNCPTGFKVFPITPDLSQITLTEEMQHQIVSWFERFLRKKSHP